MKIRDDIELGQHSHVGMARTENQDFFGYWEPDDERLFDLKGRLAVVCDGMGGHTGGEIASRMAVKAIIERYEQSSHENIVEALRESIEVANATVYDEGQRQKELAGMGTTVTALVQRRDMVYFGQVGDSRAYLIRAGQMKQMTKDHSLVQQLVDEGLLEASEMESHPDKNVILRSLGVKSEVEVDVSHIPIAPGDLFLVCSDGLSGLVTDPEMLEMIRAGEAAGKSLRQICEDLVDQANKAGGHDNITVQMLRIGQTDTATTDTTPESTVTAAFTPDQVQQSIAAARAEAAAKAGASGSGPVSDSGAVSADSGSDTGAAFPATQPSMPVPTLEEAPSSSGGGGGAAKLVLGMVLGLCLGAGGMFGANLLMARTGAEGARGEAKAALEKAKAHADTPVYGQAKTVYESGTAAFDENRFDEARSRFLAAQRLCDVAGESE